MAIKVKGHQAGDCHTRRVLYSRHGSMSLSELYVTWRLFDPTSSNTLSDFLNLFILGCELRVPSQQYNLTRNQDIGAVAQTHSKNRDVTDSQNIIDRSARGANDIFQCLHDCKSNMCNSHGCRSFLSTPKSLTVCQCDNDDTKEQTEHSSRVSQSTANTTTSRSNSCRNNPPAHEQLTPAESKKLELSSNSNSLISYSGRCSDPSLDTAQVNPRRTKFPCQDKSDIGRSSSHGRVSTVLSEIKVSSPTGGMKQRAVKNGCRSSGQTASTMSTHNMSWRNESGKSENGPENRANTSDGENSHAASWERSVTAEPEHRMVTEVEETACVGSSVTAEPGHRMVTEVEETACVGSSVTAEAGHRMVTEVEETACVGSSVTTEPGHRMVTEVEKTACVGSSVTTEPGLPAAIEVEEAADKGEHVDEWRRNPSYVRSPATPASAPSSASAQSGSANQKGKKTKMRKRIQRSYKRGKTCGVKTRPLPSSRRGSVSDFTEVHIAGSYNISTSASGSSASDSGSSASASSSASEQSVTSTDNEADRQAHRDTTDNRRRKFSGAKLPTSATSIRGSVSDQSNSANKKTGKKTITKPKSGGKKAGVAKRGKAPGKAKKKPVQKRKKKRKGSAGMAAGLFQIPPMEDTDSRPSSGEDSEAQYPPDSIAGVITDDHFVIRRLQSRNELPFNRYTSLSLILNAPEIAGDTPLQDKLMVVRKTDINPMQTTMLQPLHHSIPYYMSVARKKKIAGKVEKIDPNAIPPRIPPVALADAYHEQGIGRPSHLAAPAEFHFPGQKWSPRHDGIEWPVKYASKPPYSTPSYNGPGVKQPVGVVPLEKVPWQPEYGIVGNHFKIKIPTWVSPLYKPYGIGGHVSPEAPVTDYDIFTQPGLKKKPDTGFCQWLKNLFKPSKSKEQPRSTPMPRRSSIFGLRRKSQQINKTADIPSDSYTASTEPPFNQFGDTLTREPAAAAQESEPRQSVDTLPGAQAEGDRFSFTQRPSVTETEAGDRPSVSEDTSEIKRASVTEDSSEVGRGSVSEDSGENKRPSVTESERGSVSEDSGENKRPSVTDSERGSVSEDSGDNKRPSVTERERGSVSEDSGENKRPSVTGSERGSVSEDSGENKRPSVTESERGSVSENPVDTKRGSVSKRPSA